MAENARMSSASRQNFSNKLKTFVIRNKNKMEVQLLNYGAIISSIKVPDRNGIIEDILIGFKDLADYWKNPAYFGAVIGRVANRVENGRFKLDGSTIQLTCNEGNNHLHGGLKGFDKHFWYGIMDKENNSVSFSLNSPDGDEGYPGELDVNVVYTLSNENELKITFKAVTDKPTIVNLTSHPYFNLSGTEKKCDEVTDHLLQINASHYLPVNGDRLPTGERRSVTQDGGIFDYRQAKPIGTDLDKVDGCCYDHTFCKCGDHVFCASVYHPLSGRSLKIYSSQPGIHIYTPNFTCGSLIGKHGAAYSGRSAFCIENQNFPNTVNQHTSQSPILRPGEVYEHFTSMKFSKQ